jgi:hypothetical protein
VSDNACKDAVLEVLGYLELTEMRNRAVIALLKDKGVFNEEELEASLRQASNAIDVENTAIRARLDALFPEPSENAA